MNDWLHNNQRLLICIFLVVVTFAVYLPVRNHEFVRYDDDVYVTENPNVLTGLTPQNIEWAFTTGHAANWHPLTWLSLMLDCQIFGVKSGPMHLVNVAFHVANTLLLFIVFGRMTKRLWPSAFVAALFALHPLHVESVAWVAERKDVLSTLFWFLTMLAYVHYVEKPSAARYIITLVVFALGLMSKPMLVTLPFVLMLIDYWPLNRFQNSQFSILNSVIEKLPFLVLAAVSSIITYIVQQKGGAVAIVPFKERLANAIVSYLAYIEKLFVPVNLAVFYPHPADLIPLTELIISALILILLAVFLLYYGRRYKYLAFGWLWYFGTLVPVIGIVQVGAQAMADRYTYVPLIGLFIIIAFGAADLLKRLPSPSGNQNVLFAYAIVILFACILVTSAQLKYWQNSFTLFDHTLAVTKNNGIILNNYANILAQSGKNIEAAKCFVESLRLKPDSYEIRNNYGNVLKSLGKLDESVEQYNVAIKLKPDYYIARFDLGIALDMQGKYDEAIEQYKIYLGPDANLPLTGVTDETTRRFKNVLTTKTDTISVLSLFGQALARKGNPTAAINYYQQALRLDPDNIVTHGRLALALAAIGKTDEAIEQCRIVLSADPNDAEMHNNVGILLRSKNKLNEAAESFKKALQIDPNFQPARDNLNRLIQTQP
ncbi:MAG: tetratricopeptide repeat protein [Sedimentisphaerales bacterium]